jgi:SAM-dependent methyltransferase
MNGTASGLGPAPIDEEARRGATRQWNATACGELDGAKSDIAYFERVREDRYRQQPWQHEYFAFHRFAGRDVLEIGVGQGTDLLQFAEAGARCHGVDITDNHLELTRRNFELRGRSVDLRKSDATALPFADSSLDCVYSFGVVHHIPEADRVIAEACRVLRPGGDLLLAHYHFWSAFHLVKLLLLRGILAGALLRIGYAGLLATIESGADGRSVKPYVRLYTKRSMRERLRAFEIEDISVHQLAPSHFLPGSLFGRWRYSPLPLASRFGWYVAARARKPISA